MLSLNVARSEGEFGVTLVQFTRHIQSEQLKNCKEFESHDEESFPGSGKLNPCKEQVYLLKTKRHKIEFMVKNKDIFSLEKMEEVLDVARSSYYLAQKLSKRCMENQKIVEKAREVYHKSRGTYGSLRVARLMKKANQGRS